MPQRQSKPAFTGQPVPGRAAARHPRRSRWILASLLAVWLALFVLLLVYQNAISDWWQLRGYTAPSQVVQLANQDTMTPYARHLFYLNKPELLSSVNSFRTRCPQNKDNIVLGCYHPVESGIYIYNVQDPKLQGVSQVTAAHETLHAIYGRLNDKDKSQVNKLLQDYYQNGLKDPQVKAEIDQYKKTEPNAVLDEMHSTFGTEIVNLPPALENYYKQYFTDRQAIIRFSQQYESEFSSRRQVVARDDAQLASLKSQIDSQQTALSAQAKQLNADKQRLDGLRSSGNTSSYNAAVPGYNAAVNSYNSGISSLKILITQYNQLVVVRNSVATELNTLDKALDTRVVQTAN